MMHQNTPFHDFEEFEAAPDGGGRTRWILAIPLLATMLAAAAGVGYGWGRGTWTIPSSITEHVPASLAGWLPAPGSPPTGAGTPVALKDYAFELTDARAKQGEAVLAVRLVHKPTGKPTPDAVVFAHRLDMAPSGMPTMTTELEPQPATEPGLYRFKTNLTMAGDWQLSLAAKVQGQTGTVQTKLALKAVP
ncbi:FixH family protein [Methylobacterium durans]|uniref:Capsular biosynthesis protein n=1 Tax=Methylobacterium durans TaxID=2202825 RepID=A0A2U8WAG6_9HYPH|nr:capsular biosynthesis protein [Methylobacterium durans]